MANLKTTEKKTKAQSKGMHTEVLTGKTQQILFNPDDKVASKIVPVSPSGTGNTFIRLMVC